MGSAPGGGPFMPLGGNGGIAPPGGPPALGGKGGGPVVKKENELQSLTGSWVYAPPKPGGPIPGGPFGGKGGGPIIPGGGGIPGPGGKGGPGVLTVSIFPQSQDKIRTAKRRRPSEAHRWWWGSS